MSSPRSADNQSSPPGGPTHIDPPTSVSTAVVLAEPPPSVAIPIAPPADEMQVALLDQNREADTHGSYCCHMGAPIYVCLTNTLINSIGMITLCSCPWFVAAPVACIGGSSAAYTQFKYISQTASSNSASLARNIPADREPATCADEFQALMTVFASCSEGAKFGFGTYLGMDASGFGLLPKLIGAGIASLFRKTVVMQTEGQKAFFERGKKFGDTWIGFLAEYTNHIPCLLDFNTIVREGTPNLEAALHALAVNAALNHLSIAPRALLMMMASSGEWYLQRGYNVHVIAYVQDLSTQREAVGLAWLINNMIRVYNESIGNILNGRLINDSIGIVVPPQLIHTLSELFGRSCTGIAAGIELPKLVTDLYKKLGHDLPSEAALALAGKIAMPLFALACAWVAYSHLKAASRRELPVMSRDASEPATQVVGTVTELKQVYQSEHVELDRKNCSSEGMSQRFNGVTANVSSLRTNLVNSWQPHPSLCSSDEKKDTGMRRRRHH